MIETSQLLQIAPWAERLTAAQIDRARAGIAIKQYPAGATVGSLGIPSDAWMGVIEGLLKLRILSEDGREASLTGVHAGAWFGEGSVLKGENRRYEIFALRDTKIALMERQTFLWLFDNSLAFNQYLVRLLNQRLGQFIGLVVHDRMLGPAARMARMVSSQFDPVLYPGVGDTLELTQEEAGLLAGLTRPVANRALKSLAERGLIRLDYGRITVLDREGLERMVS